MSAPLLFVDFETRSACDLKLRSLDNYAKDPSTKVLMLAWAINDAMPSLWFPHISPEIPEEVLIMMQRREITKYAYKADFERTIFREVLGVDTPIEQWVDPGDLAKYASIAGSLEFVGKVLGLSEDKAKLAVGKKLINRFCKPKKDGSFNDWNSHPEEWETFCEYCKQDVIAEREIFQKLNKHFSLPKLERRICLLDGEINDRGMPVDPVFIDGATKIVGEEHSARTQEMLTLTGLDNPNSPKQLLKWVKEQGYPFGSLGENWVTKALAEAKLTEEGEAALKLRQVLAKSSTAKLVKLKDFTGPDGYLRGQYVYYGAARTGRWSGRGVQLHNLPRGTVKKKLFHAAVEAVRTGNVEAVRQFGPPLEVVSSCIRGGFRAPKGKHFVVCDLSAIENIVLGWLSDCRSILEVFEKGLDPYLSFGVRFHGRSYEDLLAEYESGETKTRQDLKAPVLGGGYQLGAGRLAKNKNGDEIKTGLWGYAANLGIELTQEFCAQAIVVFRESYPEVVDLWKDYENAAQAAIRTGEPQRVRQITFRCKTPGRMMYIDLPAGRSLHYIRPKIELRQITEDWENVNISYEGQLPQSKTWGKLWSYGGKLTENIDQAVSRDILAHGMLRAKDMGFEIVGSTHDEIISLVDNNSHLNLTLLRDAMTTRPTWCPDLPLKAEGFEDEIYRKG